ncbi:hypothetical protein RhiirA5_481253 [Rhizophagus irregularis]|uniref:Uncharacterized protein n=1 Tax=Rhizophagus irregularis TaxID=588596 RepID=A0A2N0PJK3_9GLOM|nr:hypothetical protein RhiirA5_481253 [Rhizophagus irregularis]CAB5208737.1 unnamed protein product [Rhizophagus irregularis]
MQSNDSLKELNAKLLTEIAKLRKENAEIPELKEKLLRFAEVKAENAKLKQIIEKNARRDAKVEELEQKNAEHEARFAIVEQSSVAVDGQSQNDKEVTISTVDVSVVDQLKQHVPVCKANDVVSEVLSEVNFKSPEEREMDKFLNEAALVIK